MEDTASAQNAWMISARRCPMVIRRAYWATSALVLIWSSLVMMTVGCSRPKPVTTSWRTVRRELREPSSADDHSFAAGDTVA